MKYDPNIHRRRSIRLKGYDYSQAGWYFITICTHNRLCLFGGVQNGEMVLNDAGMMVQTVWNEIPPHYPEIATDEFIIMPNHVHGIIIVGAGPRACPDMVNCETGPRACPNQANHETGTGQPRGVAPTLSLPDIIHRFKTMTTKRYTDGVQQHGWMPFPGKLWQRNYYEHIIRDEKSHNRISEYIQTNPLRWRDDKYYED